MAKLAAGRSDEVANVPKTLQRAKRFFGVEGDAPADNIAGWVRDNEDKIMPGLRTMAGNTDGPLGRLTSLINNQLQKSVVKRLESLTTWRGAEVMNSPELHTYAMMRQLERMRL